MNSYSVAVIGAGPAGLMAAEILAAGGVAVDVYDAMPSAGRKFLLAGIGGMNITHSEPAERFLTRYGARSAELAPMLDAFGAQALRDWVAGLGIDTFVGSSGRVFPTEMKAAPLLRAWLQRLRDAGVRFHMRHVWQGWQADELIFDNGEAPLYRRPDATVLALGGGSWPRLGSNAAWVPMLRDKGIRLEPLAPANCGFDIGWSEHFSSRFAGQPLRAVSAGIVDAQGRAQRRVGEFVVTQTGIEGSLIYALSAELRDTIVREGSATLSLDLTPGLDLAKVEYELAWPRGTRSMANHLRARIRVDGVKAGLLREVVPAADFSDPARLAAWIKALPLVLRKPRPIEEAISSAGGVPFSELNGDLMLDRLPGVFCAGEMLDWEAPTGGYLLTACFASGHQAGEGVLRWLQGSARA